MPLDLTVPAVKNATKRAHYLRLLNNILAVQGEYFPTQTFRGLRLMTHPDEDLAPSRVYLHHADEIVMQDGTRVGPWDRLSADIGTSGANGLDTGAAVNNTHYQIYAIRKSSDGTKGLLLHRAKDYHADTTGQFTTAYDATRALRLATSTATDKLAQSFQVGTAGLLEAVSITLSRAGAVSGRVWVTIEADSAGAPSGTPLATSDKLYADQIATGVGYVRLLFRTQPTLATSTTYWLVLQGDYTRSDTVFIGWSGVAAGGYANGSAQQYNGTAWSAATGVGDFQFYTYIVRNDTTPTWPTNYNQYALIGWVCYATGAFVRFDARDRVVQIPYATLTSGTAPTILTQVGLGNYGPPVPIRLLPLLIGGTGAVAGAQFELGGLPHGYKGVSAINPARTSTTIPATNALVPIDGVPTEMQAIYFSLTSGSGSAALYANGYVW